MDSLDAEWNRLAALPVTGNRREALQEIVRATGANDHASVGRLARHIPTLPLASASVVAAYCLELVAQGADPGPLVAPILTRVTAELPRALAFAEACREYGLRALADYDDRDDGVPDPAEINDWIMSFGDDVVELNPDVAHDVSQLLQPLMTLMLISPSIRDAARAQEGLAIEIDRLLEIGEPGFADSVRALLRTLDDDVVVLHPGARRGWRVHAAGISDNYQLDILLGAALLGEGGLPGTAPDMFVVDAATDGPVPTETSKAERACQNFTMMSWRALRPDLSLAMASTDNDLNIPLKGFPTDIDSLAETRLILLGQPPHPMIYPAGRRFTGIRGELHVLDTLSAEAVQSWFTRIIAATDR